MKKTIALAYYLPQYHSIKQNDEWWGKGFTEWVALRNAKKYNSWQKIRRPVMPLLEYNLPNKETMELQNTLAKENFIDGFFLWDYWFGNDNVLLEKPKKFLLDNSVNFNYALIWANHSWYNKKIGSLLIEQKYLGKEDYIKYFNACLPHFRSAGYIKIDNKPIFGIFMPKDIPDLDVFISIFQRLAKENGFNGIYFIAENSKKDALYLSHFDAYLNSAVFFSKRKTLHPFNFFKEQIIKKLNINLIGPVIYNYNSLVSKHTFLAKDGLPVVFTGWDTTPRHGKRGTIFRDFNEENFRAHLHKVFSFVSEVKPELIIIKSWNEWAEGNILEPDCIFGNDLIKIYSSIYAEYFNAV